MRRLAATIAAILTMSLPAAAQATAGFSLREWSALDEHERKVSIVAAVEGLMLSSSAGDASTVDADCLIKISIPTVDDGLRKMAVARDGEFVAAMLEESKCSRP